MRTRCSRRRAIEATATAARGARHGGRLPGEVPDRDPDMSSLISAAQARGPRHADRRRLQRRHDPARAPGQGGPVRAGGAVASSSARPCPGSSTTSDRTRTSRSSPCSGPPTSPSTDEIFGWTASEYAETVRGGEGLPARLPPAAVLGGDRGLLQRASARPARSTRRRSATRSRRPSSSVLRQRRFNENGQNDARRWGHPGAGRQAGRRSAPRSTRRRADLPAARLGVALSHGGGRRLNAGSAVPIEPRPGPSSTGSCSAASTRAWRWASP